MISTNIDLGVIHQRSPSKNWHFGPPPCQTSSVLETAPPLTNVRIVTRVNVRKVKYFAFRTFKSIRSDKIFCVCERPVYARLPPDPVHVRPHWFIPPPPFDRTSLMDDPLFPFNMYLIIDMLLNDYSTIPNVWDNCVHVWWPFLACEIVFNLSSLISKFKNIIWPLK